MASKTFGDLKPGTWFIGGSLGSIARQKVVMTAGDRAHAAYCPALCSVSFVDDPIQVEEIEQYMVPAHPTGVAQVKKTSSK